MDIIKKKCQNCNKKPGLLTTCKFCESKYCFNCLQFEIHRCEGLVVMKEKKRRSLEGKLESERCVKPKIDRI